MPEVAFIFIKNRSLSWLIAFEIQEYGDAICLASGEGLELFPSLVESRNTTKYVHQMKKTL